MSGEQLELATHEAGGPARTASVPPDAPTPEQRRAIDARDRDVLLEAGAGTGKTRVLVERYCAAAEQEEHGVDAILAFTFTERAAAELRHRIREELSRRATEALSAGDGERAPQARGARPRQRAGLDLDHPRLLPTAPRGPPGRPGTRSPLSGARRGGSRPTRAPRLRRGARVAAGRRRSGAAPSWLPRCGFPTCATWSAPRTTSCEARGASRCSPSRPTPTRRTRSRRWRSRREPRARRPRAGAAGPGTWSDLPRRRPSIRHRACPREPELAELKLGSSAQAFGGAACAAYRTAWKRARSALAERDAIAHYRHIAELLGLFAHRYAALKDERSGLDFEDLQLEARRLLTENPGVADTYRARFRHLMVDEFQDTNRLQLELVGLLRDDRDERLLRRRRIPVHLRLSPRRRGRLPPRARSPRGAAGHGGRGDAPERQLPRHA